MGSGGDNPRGLTERQRKWFATVQAGLVADTGKSLDEWVAIARTCPEARPRARVQWMKDHHGLGMNRASVILSLAFPSANGWDNPAAERDALWADPASRTIFAAVEGAATALPSVVVGQRKAFTGFSREFQFAALKPLKGGKAVLGLAVDPAADPRLAPPKNEGWSERLKSKLVLEAAGQVDGSVTALLKQAWEKS
jgi:hypothetical protein